MAAWRDNCFIVYVRGVAVLWLFVLVAGYFGERPIYAGLDETASRSGAAQLSLTPSTEDIQRLHRFEEPLAPVGVEPNSSQNAALLKALTAYSSRKNQDDFTVLEDFLAKNQDSPWSSAVLANLGIDYYNTAHFSLALAAWKKAWDSSKGSTDPKARAIANRALSELIRMDSRLGRMEEIQTLLKEIEGRTLFGPAVQHVADAREALWTMQNRPEIAFRCGPLALRGILAARGEAAQHETEILDSASTRNGCSLPQVANLSCKVGLNFQMAFREHGAPLIIPSVVHWKVGHYAALLQQQGNLFQLQDPTFGNQTWASSNVFETEASGYFLVPGGALPKGWRSVTADEAFFVWGKGLTANNDSRAIARNDLKTSDQTCHGMIVPTIHLMAVNLSLKDEPLGYSPPVGPDVRFRIYYNQRDAAQPATFDYSNLGYNWTCEWISYLTDNPSNLFADVTLYAPGGGERTFSGFSTNTQSFAFQQYDHSLLTRTGPDSYEILASDGSKMVFSHPNGSTGTSRKVFLSQIIDSAGNAVTLTYDANLRITALTDAIGQVTTLTYGYTNDIYKITKVTDPFGRFATINYLPEGGIANAPLQLSSITDVIGLTSQVDYRVDYTLDSFGHIVFTVYTTFVEKLTTPYGQTIFTSADSGNTRVLEVTYPDSSRERVEFNQTNTLQALSDNPSLVPYGMLTRNANLRFRNTYYWDKVACAQGYRDYSKARLYHFMHTENLASTSGALESTKLPLEGRVWYDYSGQADPTIISSNVLPTHIGRVLDDGSTQLYTYGYNQFGLVTNSVDPVGRRFSITYDTNGIDPLELRQIRAGNNDLISKLSFDSHHRPLSITDQAGQTATMTYNARGQVLTITDPKNQTLIYSYDTNGYLIAVTTPFPVGSVVRTNSYDSFGRLRTRSDINGFITTYAYDALDRITNISYQDGTSSSFGFTRLDLTSIVDRAGRQTSIECDNMRHPVKITDALGRVTRMEWCRCGTPKTVVDPLGRATVWRTDVQGRKIAKQMPDGSRIDYFYENTLSRMRQVVDEQGQSKMYSYNADNTLRNVSFPDAAIPTASTSYTYDPNYKRVISITDGIGTTIYHYNPIGASPVAGAGRLGSVDGPYTNDTVTYVYDDLGQVIRAAIDGTAETKSFDTVSRITSVSNALGAFAFVYDGNSARLSSMTGPNGQKISLSYGSLAQDLALNQISNSVGGAPLSVFGYGRDLARGMITSFSQRMDSQPVSTYNFFYDQADQLVSAAVTNSGLLVGSYAYSYDPAGNRLTEQVGGVTSVASYNSLNQLSALSNSTLVPRTNEWDARHRLTAVQSGNQRTEFAYDGMGRLASIRQLQNGSEVTFRRFIWCLGRLCQERDSTGTVVTKRFFPQGVKFETGTNAGSYYYTRDHLGSVREMTDASGNLKARYSYDPFGRRTKVTGNVDSDFGFAGYIFSPETALTFPLHRVYDPEQGRWLSRDPLPQAETRQGPNLYAYVANEPVDNTDSSGLGFDTFSEYCVKFPTLCQQVVAGGGGGAAAYKVVEELETALPEVEIAAAPLECASSSTPTFPGLGVARDTIVDIVEEVAPEVAEAPEISELLAPGNGQTVQQLLLDAGEIGGTGGALGPNAQNVMQQFLDAESGYFAEFQEFMEVYSTENNPVPDILRFEDAFRLAHKLAVDFYGFDPYVWDRLSSL